jgi:hypothetical protein
MFVATRVKNVSGRTYFDANEDSELSTMSRGPRHHRVERVEACVAPHPNDVESRTGAIDIHVVDEERAKPRADESGRGHATKGGARRAAPPPRSAGMP